MANLQILFFCIMTGLAVLPSAALTLDIKTKLLEKSELTACKTGMVVFLERAGISVKETGEDFAVWLSNIQRVQKGDQITVRVEVHLTKASFVTEGPSLERLVVEFKYSSQPGFLTGQTQGPESGLDPKAIDRIKTALAAKAELTLAEGVMGGDALAKAVIGLLKQQGYLVKS